MTRPLPSIPNFRVSSLALVGALLFALAGLYAIDNSLSQNNRVQARVEAIQAAALLQSFLAVHEEALQSVRALYMDTTRSLSTDQFHSLLASLGRYASSFRRVWVIDSSGVVLEEHALHLPPSYLRVGMDIDTVQFGSIGRLTQAARETRVVQISGPFTGPAGVRSFIILEPLYIGQRLVGFAAASIGTDALLAILHRRVETPGRARTIIVSDGDTIAASTPLRPSLLRDETARETVELPSGERWEVAVVHHPTDAGARLLLWGVGLATLAALVVSLLHERRQGLRLAERSAELERLSSELLRANRAKSEFLANVSHELRTPLNAIVGFVDLLRDGVYGELATRQVGPVDRIASSANHLRHLVDQILDIAKIAAGRLDVYREAIELRPFVLDVVSEVEALVAEQGLNLSISIAAGLPRIYTDPTHLRQILVNLIGNAVKYTPRGGVAIRARLETQQGPPAMESRASLDSMAVRPVPRRAHGGQTWILLQVADTGVGINSTDLGRIFEEFEQVDAGPRTDSVRRGTGLGLAISRRLARLLGGDITVESELGKGSTFTVWIPVDAHDMVEPEPSTTVEAAATGGE
ncbi:MAG TPA: HAMP domain-containing sensor histidine kinase [Gemmatimonadaceae bacterium]|nr:HAMP domain-containing sensor histidine kinase [Gemmatimonadaceae bacterium]